jgi:signal transduction histidine kinase
MVTIAVKDQGPGFSEKDKSYLFQKFKKLSARPTAGESSNGLGLAIVKTLVDRLKGSISLVSEQGKGSQFIVNLPITISQ